MWKPGVATGPVPPLCLLFSRGNPEFVGQELTGVMRACGPQTQVRNEAISASSLRELRFMASFLANPSSILSSIQNEKTHCTVFFMLQEGGYDAKMGIGPGVIATQ